MYHEPDRSYYLMDVLAWAGVAMLDCAAGGSFGGVGDSCRAAAWVTWMLCPQDGGTSACCRHSCLVVP